VDAASLSRLAAIAWFAGSGVRLFVGLTGVSRFADGSTMVVAAGIGAVLGLVIGVAMWVRPGRGSALAGSLFGAYAVFGLLYLPLLNFDPWFALMAVVGVIAFILSVVTLWLAQRERATH
jgi:hypothetical protein